MSAPAIEAVDLVKTFDDFTAVDGVSFSVPAGTVLTAGDGIARVYGLDKVMAGDHAVNQLEVQLDDACSHLSVKRQPAANAPPARTVMAAIRGRERIGGPNVKRAPREGAPEFPEITGQTSGNALGGRLVAAQRPGVQALRLRRRGEAEEVLLRGALHPRPRAQSSADDLPGEGWRTRRPPAPAATGREVDVSRRAKKSFHDVKPQCSARASCW